MKKFSSILFVLLLMLASFTAGMEYPRGDVDYNGKVNISDVTSLIDYLLSGYWPGEEPIEPQDPQETEHEWVDLGLPSGTLWATCNIGADNPEDYGDYFAWGETEPKEFYSWENYKWCIGSDTTLIKYCTSSFYGYNGFIDNKTKLDPDDDAAYVNWGAAWCIPTQEQLNELRTKCTWAWTTQNGVNGRLVTGPNGNSLFLPATGHRWNDSLSFVDSWGYYWSNGPNSINPSTADILDFYSKLVRGYSDYRYCGVTVRAVRVPQN